MKSSLNNRSEPSLLGTLLGTFPAFLDELRRKVSDVPLPVVVGGDYNLLHFAEDKNDDLVYFPRMQMFSDYTVDLGLRGLDKYDLEDHLSTIYTDEKPYWRLWETQKWILNGDANTTYFHAITNGRHRRSSIPLLWDGKILLPRPTDIRDHVDGFYKALFSTNPRSSLALAAYF
ncbi:putative NOT transcription complex subunit VIP2 [Hordeum vulgare]|nr:putative NOT transcription complex subunit VIP2 [Hordeum vulgare]